MNYFFYYNVHCVTLSVFLTFGTNMDILSVGMEIIEKILRYDTSSHASIANEFSFAKFTKFDVRATLFSCIFDNSPIHSTSLEMSSLLVRSNVWD